jgi:hypothetical protein
MTTDRTVATMTLNSIVVFVIPLVALLTSLLAMWRTEHIKFSSLRAGHISSLVQNRHTSSSSASGLFKWLLSTHHPPVLILWRLHNTGRNALSSGDLQEKIDQCSAATVITRSTSSQRTLRNIFPSVRVLLTGMILFPEPVTSTSI